MQDDHQALDAATVARMSDVQFVAAVAGLSITQMDSLTARLFAGRHTDAERAPLESKYRALADHRVAQVRRENPEWFY
jgi:hypothetical protein